MTLKDLKFKPGIYSDDTDRDVGTAGYWKDCDKIRFRHGLPESMGGYAKDSATEHMTGTARGTVDWRSLRDEKIIAFGTNVKLYVWIGGLFSDITPIRSTVTINNNPFSMTISSAVVTVTDTAHGAIDGVYVTFSGAVAAGGITISGEYALTFVDTDTYTITHSAAATSTTTGGGAAVSAAYQINPGLVDSSIDLGWGAGGWGEEYWGTPRTSSDLITYARTWSLDTWGEDLIATHFNGSIYAWDSSVGVGARAVIISGAPTNNKAVTVSLESRHLIAFGADGDPLNITWCTSEDYNTWTATTTNTAGDWRIDQGNQILRAIKLRDQHIVFTDSASYTMTYVGPPYTFSVKPIGAKGLIGPNAAVTYLGICYWMGPKNFYYYDGTVQSLDCTVFDPVFTDFNIDQGFKVWAGANATYDEVWWLYCTADSNEVDRYVIYNVVDKNWAIGTLARTIYIGDSDVITASYAVSTDGYLYYHDSGTSADGAAFDAYVVSGDVEIDEGGEHMMHVSRMVPDFKNLTGTVNVTLTAKKYPHATETQSSSALAVTSSTEYVSPRVRGRQVSLRVESNSTTASWRLGTPRLELKPHGRR